MTHIYEIKQIKTLRWDAYEGVDVYKKEVIWWIKGDASEWVAI